HDLSALARRIEGAGPADQRETRHWRGRGPESIARSIVARPGQRTKAQSQSDCRVGVEPNPTSGERKRKTGRRGDGGTKRFFSKSPCLPVFSSLHRPITPSPCRPVAPSPRRPSDFNQQTISQRAVGRRAG